MQTWIGCSGFHYKHWKNLFYPDGLPQKRWFEYYCQHFNTLELNVSFYRFPRLNVLQEWAAGSPKKFRFAVKAPRFITHFRKFLNAESMISDFYQVVDEGLGKKTGCILFQLPPNFRYSEEHLQRIIEAVHPQHNNVLEFREASWWNKDVYRALAKNKISFCGMSYPGFPEDLVTDYKTFYYRFHGIPELYKTPYSEDALRQFAKHLTANAKIKTAYIYFNNDIRGSAVRNAAQLKTILSTIE